MKINGKMDGLGDEMLLKPLKLSPMNPKVPKNNPRGSIMTQRADY